VEKATIVRRVIERKATELLGAFLVITSDRVRVRRLP
jgi:hypothetical protein